MKFIKLHDKNDNAHWVNMALVTDFCLRDKDGVIMTEKWLANNHNDSPSYFHVTESPADILKAIGQYTEPHTGSLRTFDQHPNNEQGH